MMTQDKINYDEILNEITEQLSLELIQLSKKIYRSEVYGLQYRLQVTAENVPTNLKNGYQTMSKSEKVRSFIKANTTLSECRDLVEMARKVHYFNTEPILRKLEEVEKIIDDDFRNSKIQ
jgi:four helix bundle protein